MLASRRMAIAVLVLLCATSVIAREQADTRVDRMTDALVQMLPMGEIFESVAVANPAWPMQDKPEAVTPEQLACVRQELSTAGFRRSRLVDVEAYAKANPSRLDDDLQVLESGAAELFGKLISAGAKEGGGTASPAEVVLKDATTEQVLAFTKFVSDPNYAGLRKLSGFGDVLDITRSADENEKSGYQLGASLATQQMIKAMGTCKVPPSAYL